jgi:hypothetical protein
MVDGRWSMVDGRSDLTAVDGAWSFPMQPTTVSGCGSFDIEPIANSQLPGAIR